MNKLDSIYNNSEIDTKQKLEDLYKLYLEEILEELKSVHKQQLQLKL